MYAPKLKHADEKHAPPPIGKEPWSWLTALWKTKEEALVHQIGMDAVVFLRFVRMCRNLFLVLSVLGVGILVPIHIKYYHQYGTAPDKWVAKITPLYVREGPIWAQVVIAWLFNGIICFFLWWNYRKILRLKRLYFESEEYQSSLHARSLMVCSNTRPTRAREETNSSSCSICQRKAALMRVLPVSSMGLFQTPRSRGLRLLATSRTCPS